MCGIKRTPAAVAAKALAAVWVVKVHVVVALSVGLEHDESIGANTCVTRAQLLGQCGTIQVYYILVMQEYEIIAGAVCFEKGYAHGPNLEEKCEGGPGRK